MFVPESINRRIRIGLVLLAAGIGFASAQTDTFTPTPTSTKTFTCTSTNSKTRTSTSTPTRTNTAGWTQTPTGTWNSATTVPTTNPTTLPCALVVMAGNPVALANNTYDLCSLDVQAGATLFIGGAVTLNITGDANVDGVILGTGYGYGSAYALNGPGRGGGLGTSGGGGGHGGMGGRGGELLSPSKGGKTYDSATNPTQMGSEGGLNSYQSGAGGAALIVHMPAGSMTINGSILMNGDQDRLALSNGRGGGGAGGTVSIDADGLYGSGRISENGGAPCFASSLCGSGPGGGGRIRICTVKTDTHSVSMSVYAGPHGSLCQEYETYGQGGTIYDCHWPTPTETHTFTNTPGSYTSTTTRTNTATATCTFSSTNTPTATNTPTSTRIKTATATATSTGCIKTCIYPTPVPGTASATGPVTVADVEFGNCMIDKYCGKIVTGFTLTFTLSGNLPSEIIEVQLYNPGGTVATSTLTATGSPGVYNVVYSGLDIIVGSGSYQVVLITTPQASGTVSYGSWWINSLHGHQVGYTGDYIVLWNISGTANSVNITAAATPTRTNTASTTTTSTATQTSTFTPTFTRTATNSHTVTPPLTPSATGSATASATASRTSTVSSTPTGTASMTSTATQTSTNTLSRTYTPTNTRTNSPTPTSTLTRTFTRTYTNSPTFTSTNTLTPTPSMTSSETSTETPIWSPTSTDTPTGTATPPWSAMEGPQVVKALSYPNPIQVAGPVSLYYEVSGETAAVSALSAAPRGAYDATAKVTLKISTRSGRVIWQTSLTGVKAGGNSYPWNTRDLKNAPIANGVYYHTATISGKDQSSTKTSPLVILR